ncbi:nucleotide sugar dehydrogenase, partial [Candidatus Margulisiibacteriota bacterium]
GLGYVGLPLCYEVAKSKIQVIGFDIDQEKINKINKGESYIKDVASNCILEVVQESLLKATSDFSQLKEVDVISICVPTPLTKTKDPDMSYIEKAVESIKPNLRKGQIIILESTTYPGTTEEVILPILESTGLKVGADFFLAFSPERVDPGNEKYQTKNTPKVLGGVTTICSEIGKLVYEMAIDKIIIVSSPRSAEMVKLLENTFRAVNIAMANEMVLMCSKLGIDVWEVINAAATKPFGFMPFYPGPGLGGHCIPVDPHYLSWKLKTLKYDAKFIGLAGEINGYMPHYIADKTIQLLNENKKCLNGANILITGIAYKKNINDLRESPALDIMLNLKEMGANVSYHDDYFPSFKLKNEELTSKPLTPETLKASDCVIIITDHDYLDLEMIVEYSSLIFDTRNTIKQHKNAKNVKRL